ncbi:hypothetical protein AX774_g6651 [Zancudomyces culisetae]|uniref:Uncharacterized protein n=1 Tax=Zancudomyces culisetae TaxID=1213189 RepID=A0A1R1PGE5_ZANCU|nr:hypothetical protein AX774_g6651 [Zancudomyces culisetae]|eukprot:OMH79922.1 hypothetical protein AX774_g6651 [Zancudomyces culisetae]
MIIHLAFCFAELTLLPPLYPFMNFIITTTTAPQKKDYAELAILPPPPKTFHSYMAFVLISPQKTSLVTNVCFGFGH